MDHLDTSAFLRTLADDIDAGAGVLVDSSSRLRSIADVMDGVDDEARRRPSKTVE